MVLLHVLVISVALSIDAFGIGISYSLKGVAFPWISKIIIGFVSAGIMWISMEAGAVINRILPSAVTKIIGITILVIIGLGFIRNSLFGKEEATYDLNRSFKIDRMEAVILGIALSADSISAGIAVSALGYTSMGFPLAVGLMQIVFLFSGDYVVRKCAFVKKLDSKVCGVFSGGLLILIALIRGIG